MKSKYSAEIKASIIIIAIFGLIHILFYLGVFTVKRPISKEVLLEKRTVLFKHSPYGITRESEEYIWISFPSNGTISRFNIETGKIDFSLGSPVKSPWGLGYVEKSLWIAEVGTGKLYRLSLSNFTIIDCIEGNWTYPAGLTVTDRNTLWLSSLDQMKVFEINLSSGEIVGVVRVFGVFGLDFKNDSLWVSSSDMRIRRIDPTTGEVLETFYSPGRLPTGICWVGSSLWVGDKSGSLKELLIAEGRYKLLYTKPPSWLYVLLFIAFLPIVLSSWSKIGRNFYFKK
ncbi:MAG: hypothetical protein DRO00_00610 [Thermoproteota archaeon]|mgnify:CR=1 FL=1|nr:MAG: hypothetical protein DRO00_00610 [Candidatus Korarchaeota archaeon]